MIKLWHLWRKHAEVTAKLLRDVSERFSAEQALHEAEAAAALSEPADVDAAQRRVKEALTKIQRRSIVISGLRNRLVGLTDEIEAQHIAVKRALPDHIEKLKSDFNTEWVKAVQAFGAALGKRAALEGYVGKLELPQPQPAPCDLPAEVSAPWRALDELAAGLEQIAGFGRAALAPKVDAMYPAGARQYHADLVYRVTNAATGLAPERLVVDSVFPPGTLAHFLNIGYVEVAAADQWQRDLESAGRAERKLVSEREQEARQADADRDRPRLIPYDQAKAEAAAAANKRISNDAIPEHVSSGPPNRPWGESSQREVTGGL